jgi:hypothetical protein
MQFIKRYGCLAGSTDIGQCPVRGKRKLFKLIFDPNETGEKAHWEGVRGAGPTFTRDVCERNVKCHSIEKSGSTEIDRRRRNLEELSDRLNRRPWLSFQDLQNWSIDIFKRGSAGAQSVTEIRTM